MFSLLHHHTKDEKAKDEIYGLSPYKIVESSVNFPHLHAAIYYRIVFYGDSYTVN